MKHVLLKRMGSPIRGAGGGLYTYITLFSQLHKAVIRNITFKNKENSYIGRKTQQERWFCIGG
jgi:hypothetical protein